MFFAYVLENADGVEYRSNKPLFEVINEFKVKDDQIYMTIIITSQSSRE